MPAFIRTKGDEARWSKAKKAASKSKSKGEEGFTDQDWALTNYIYHKMQKAEMLQGLMEKLTKQGDDDDEEDHFQNYGEPANEDLESQGIHEFDPYQEGPDEADAWLGENDPKTKQEASEEAPEESAEAQPEEVKPKGSTSKSGYSEWQPQDKYSDEHSNAMKEFMDQGYSHREAERMAGAHRGPRDFQNALSHNVKPTQPSEKMLNELKSMAGHWLDKADRHAKINADPEKNPNKFASGKLMEAHENASKDYNKAHNEFLNSDALKDKKGMERHKAIQSWKQEYKTKHPEYLKGVGEASSAQKHFKEAENVYNKGVDERMSHILSGGAGDPSSSMGMEEAAQHVGGIKGGEDAGHMTNVVRDPSAVFAERNQPFIQQMQAGRSAQTRGPQTRMGGAQDQQAKAAAPARKVDPTAAKQVIIRRAKPDQLDRFNRTVSARGTLGVKPPSEGDK